MCYAGEDNHINKLNALKVYFSKSCLKQFILLSMFYPAIKIYFLVPYTDFFSLLRFVFAQCFSVSIESLHRASRSLLVSTLPPLSGTRNPLRMLARCLPLPNTHTHSSNAMRSRPSLVKCCLLLLLPLRRT